MLTTKFTLSNPIVPVPLSAFIYWVIESWPTLPLSSTLVSYRVDYLIYCLDEEGAHGKDQIFIKMFFND